jgi:hypothetical protein
VLGSAAIKAVFLVDAALVVQRLAPRIELALFIIQTVLLVTIDFGRVRARANKWSRCTGSPFISLPMSFITSPGDSRYTGTVFSARAEETANKVNIIIAVLFWIVQHFHKNTVGSRSVPIVILLPLR